jgi:hypothetical protein
MSDLVSELLGLVRKEILIYRDLIEHARRKTSLLVTGNLSDILESNRVEETFNLKLRLLENQVTEVCSKISGMFAIPREEFTLLKLADQCEQHVAEEIKSQTGLFKDLIEQLKTVNRGNRRLAESSIAYSRGLLDFLGNATSSYQGTGLFRTLPAGQTTISHQA